MKVVIATSASGMVFRFLYFLLNILFQVECQISFLDVSVVVVVGLGQVTEGGGPRQWGWRWRSRHVGFGFDIFLLFSSSRIFENYLKLICLEIY